eukprot:7598000-Prorocentrum_lima.AAC.1
MRDVNPPQTGRGDAPSGGDRGTLARAQRVGVDALQGRLDVHEVVRGEDGLHGVRCRHRGCRSR